MEPQPEACRLFNFDYPANLAVRNTFLEVSLQDDQVQRFFEKLRRAQSCPGGASNREKPRGWLVPVADEPEVEQQLTMPAAPTDGAAAGVVGAGVIVVNGPNNAYGIEHGGFVLQQEVVEDMLPFMPQVQPKVSMTTIDTQYCSLSPNCGHLPPMESNTMDTRFSAADHWWVQEEPLEIRNVGSAGHNTGRCKPCAFIHTDKGCMQGIECKFCHRCEPGEKKRRRREKWERVRQRRELRRPK